MISFSLTSETGPHSTRLHVVGELDHYTAGRFTDAATAHLDRDGPRHLHLDFAGLTLCDSSGLAALVMVRRRASAAGVQLHLDNRPPALERLLQITSTLAYLTAPVVPHSPQAESSAAADGGRSSHQ